MDKQLIIAVSREFGSGGHVIAEELAKRFDLPLYDSSLLRKIAEILGRGLHRAVFRIPYDKGALVRLLHDEANVLSMEYAEDGTRIEAVVKPEQWARVREYAEERQP